MIVASSSFSFELEQLLQRELSVTLPLNGCSSARELADDELRCAFLSRDGDEEQVVLRCRLLLLPLVAHLLLSEVAGEFSTLEGDVCCSGG